MGAATQEHSYASSAKFSSEETSKQEGNHLVPKTHCSHVENEDENASCFTCYLANKKNKLTAHMKELEAIKEKHTPISVSNSSYSHHNFCKECKRHYKYTIGFDDHILKNHPDKISIVTSKVFFCTNCKYQTTYKRDYEKHMLMHSQPPSKPHPCPHCRATPKSRLALDDHILIRHPIFVDTIQSKVYHCKQCGHKTVFKSEFESHMLKHQPNISKDSRIFICTDCNEKFSSTVLLRQHILNDHSAGEYEPKAHVIIKYSGRVSDDSSAFVCTTCDKKFKSRTWLRHHVIRKHPKFTSRVLSKIHGCPECEFKTIFKSDLARHMIKHSEIKYSNINITPPDLDDQISETLDESEPSETLNCPNCDFKTTDKKTFDVHVLEHSQTKLVSLFSCAKCDAHFTNKIHLDQHLHKNHSRAIHLMTYKLLRCPGCTYQSKFKSKMSKHVSIEHPEMIHDDSSR
ncbi:unnamed protein product [Acanthoscelides obtectus]|nr:unnamed protein product [Acanthoscelides obtectus]CAK1638141.1 Zinc finger protein 425 [Acanthoscelides obtectus]